MCTVNMQTTEDFQSIRLIYIHFFYININISTIIIFAYIEMPQDNDHGIFTDVWWGK